MMKGVLVLSAVLVLASGLPQASPPTTDAAAGAAAVAPATTANTDAETTVPTTTAAAVPTVDLRDKTLRIVTTTHPDEPMRAFLDQMTSLLQADLGFNYTREATIAYGFKQEGEWNGMIGKLVSGEADVAIADLSVTAARDEVVDFTTPFIQTGITVLGKKSDVGNQSTVAAFLLPEGDTGVNATVLRHGSTQAFLSEASCPVLKKIYAKIMQAERAGSDRLVNTLAEGVERVRGGGVAMFMEHLYARNQVNQDCSLTTVGDPLNTIDWALALPKGSPYTQLFSRAIHKLKASGQIDQLKLKLWLKPRPCPGE